MFCFAFDCLNIALELIAVAYSQVLYYNSESLYDTWNRRYCPNQGEKASNEISQLIHIDEKIIFFFVRNAIPGFAPALYTCTQHTNAHTLHASPSST